jgi:wingless-type MMTV integration site family protein 2
MRTCWKAMQSFSEVGTYLKHKYNGATRVQISQARPQLIVAHQNHKSPTKNDLVYIEDSPDYCVRNVEAGKNSSF